MNPSAPRSSAPVALVTGGGRGLGAGICRHLARSGWDVAIHCHESADGAEAVRRDVEAAGRKGLVIRADLGREAGAIRLREAFGERFGHLELLVNNAGVYHEVPFLELTEEQWFAELNSTATAVYFTTRAFLPLLRESRGRIINLGDGSCDRPGARTLAPGYHIGKTGVYLLTRSFAKSEAPHGVAVNLLSPGLLETSVGLGDPGMVPAGRFGTFDDVFAALDFLVSVDTPYLTGSHLIVGGGWNL
jgi:3-oxoacyl-[acyl-carrier protein] reductase